MIGDDDIEPWDDFNEIDLSKKKYASDEQREKNSISQKKLWEDPEYRKRNLTSQRNFAIRNWEKIIGDRRKTIIKEFKEVHKNKYDFSKVDYQGMTKKVIVICKLHGEFLQYPSALLKGKGCPKCGRIERDRKLSKMYYGRNPNNKRTDAEIIKQFRLVHGNRYDYSKMKFIRQSEPITVICREHGEFKVRELLHRKGRGHCPRCPKEKIIKKKKYNTNEIISKFKSKFKNRFDYSEFEYKGTVTKSIFICKKHGRFSTTPHNHLKSVNGGCPECIRENNKKSSLQSKNLWKDPEYRKKTIEGIKRTRDGKKQSEINKGRWKNPEYAKKISETFRKKRLKNIDKQLKIMRKNSLTIRTQSDSVWNKDRDKIFFDLLKEGMSFSNMSKKMGISESSLRNRFYRLQVIQKK